MTRGTLLTVALGLATSCSFLGPHPRRCAENAECRSAFGPGSVCVADGFCDLSEVPARCARTFPADLLTTHGGYPDAVTVGTLFDHAAEKPVVQAARLAVIQANAAGGIDGRPLVLIECDLSEGIDASTPDEALPLLAAFLDQAVGAAAIVGPSSSDGVRAAFEASDEAVLISPAASSPALTALEGDPSDDAPGRVWRTVAPSVAIAEAIAADLRARGVSQVAVVHGPGLDDEGLATAIVDAFGPAPVHPYASAAERDALARQLTSSPGLQELIFTGSALDAAAFLNAAGATAGADAKSYFFGPDAAHPWFIEFSVASAALYPQVRGARSAPPTGPVWDAFAGSYAVAYPGQQATDGSHTAQAWDAAWLALYGAAWAHAHEIDADGPGVARGLRRLSAGPAVELRGSSWAAAQGQIHGGVDVSGASGELDYDPADEETTAPAQLWEIVGGEIVAAD